MSPDFSSLIPRIAQILNSGPATAGACLFICGFAIYWHVTLIRRGMGTILAELDQANTRLKKFSNAPDFYHAYEDVKLEMMSLDSLRDAWIQLDRDKGWVEKGGTKEISVYGGVDRFFGLPVILSTKVDLRQLTRVPNQLTGLGILGTFLGLFAGISMAQDGFGSGNDPARTREALQQLLQGASMAFITSLFGLFLSLVFAWSEQSNVKKAQEVLGSYLKRLRFLIRERTAESIPADQLAELKTQTFQLEKFNTELGINIGNALGSRVSQTLEPLTKTLLEAVELLKGSRQQMDQDMLKGMAEQFRSAMTGGVGTEISGATSALASLGSTLDKTTEHFAARMESATKHSSEALESSFTRLASLVDRIDTSSANIEKTMRQSTELGEKIERSGSRFQEHLGVIEKMGHDLSEASRRLESTSGSLGDFQSNIQQWLTSLKSTQERLVSLQETTSKDWQDYRMRFEGLDQTLERTFERLREGLESFRKNITQFHQEVDSQMAKAIQNLHAGLSPLEAIDDLREIMEELSQTLGKLDQKS